MRLSFKFMLAAIAVIVVLLYAPSLRNGFVDYDDGGLIGMNAMSHGLSVWNITAAFSRYDPELYIPLTFVSYQLDYTIAGLAPWIYHAHAVLLHALAALFVAATFYLLSGKNRWVGLVTGLLYALHPIESEAVLWAAARKDVQAAAFFWIACWAYLQYRECHESVCHGEERGVATPSLEPSSAYVALFIGSLIAFLIALLSKVSVIVLPVLLILFDYYRDGRLTRRSLIRMIPYAVLSFVFGIVALFGKGEAGSGLPMEKALIGARATVLYLTNTIWPVGFSVLYPYTKPLSILTPDLLLSVILVCILTVAVLLLATRHKLPVFAWFFYLICLLPSFSNFAKGLEPPYDVYIGSDRYAMLGITAVFFAVAVTIDRWRRGREMIVNSITGGVIVILAALTFMQTSVWRDTESLFSHTLAYYPEAQTAHNNLGGVYFNRGETDKAIAQYKAALRVRPSATAHFNLGQAYRSLGRDDDAIAEYHEAVRLYPRADAYVNIGIIFLGRKSFTEAANAFEEAEKIDLTLSLIPFNLGLAYEGMGKKQEAITAFKRALELDPTDSEAKQHLSALES